MYPYYICVCILFLEKYDYVGRLLKPGESHSYYTDEEETPTNKLHLENPKQCEPENSKNNIQGDILTENELPKSETKDKDSVYINNSDNSSLNNINDKSDAIKSSNGSAIQDDSCTFEK